MRGRCQIRLCPFTLDVGRSHGVIALFKLKGLAARSPTDLSLGLIAALRGDRAAREPLRRPRTANRALRSALRRGSSRPLRAPSHGTTTARRSAHTPGHRLRDLLTPRPRLQVRGHDARQFQRPHRALAVRQAGFDATYISGAATSVCAGVPDVGLLTLEHFCRLIRRGPRRQRPPLIADADTGFERARWSGGRWSSTRARALRAAPGGSGLSEPLRPPGRKETHPARPRGGKGGRGGQGRNGTRCGFIVVPAPMRAVWRGSSRRWSGPRRTLWPGRR